MGLANGVLLAIVACAEKEPGLYYLVSVFISSPGIWLCQVGSYWAGLDWKMLMGI
jgi:hypothetical protein